MVIYSNGQGSVVLRVKLRSSAVATGAGLTGLTSASAGLIIATIADTEATTTRYRASSSEVEAVGTLGTYAAPTSGKCRFSEVDATNHPGLYEIHLADARLAVSNAKSAIVSVIGATNLVETDLQILLQKVNPYDAVRGGMTALPNANADAAGGLPISDAGGLDLDARLDAAVSSRLASAGYTAPLDAAGTRSAIGLVSANLDTQLDALPTASENASAVAAQVTADHGSGSYVRNTEPLDAVALRTAVGLASANLDTQLDAIPTNAELATALAGADDAVLAAIAALNNLSSAGAQSAAEAALAAYGAALQATLTTVAGYLDTEVAAIKAKTDNLPAAPAATGDIPTAAQVADKVLGRNQAGGSDGGRTVTSALRALRNKVVIDGATIAVYEEDDVTVAWSGTVTRADLDALQTVDPS